VSTTFARCPSAQRLECNAGPEIFLLAGGWVRPWYSSLERALSNLGLGHFHSTSSACTRRGPAQLVANLPPGRLPLPFLRPIDLPNASDHGLRIGAPRTSTCLACHDRPPCPSRLPGGPGTSAGISRPVPRAPASRGEARPPCAARGSGRVSRGHRCRHAIHDARDYAPVSQQIAAARVTPARRFRPTAPIRFSKPR